MTKHILIAGATGVVGYAALKHFAGRGDCHVTAVSRRQPLETFGARFHSLDLMDAQACKAFAQQHADVTHVVYAALYEKPGLYAGWFEADQIETNQRMFKNFFDPLEAQTTELRHISLLQGTKAYGAHARPIVVPAREDRDEVRDVPNFYWEQETHLRTLQAGKPWSFTILRPQVIFGISIGAAMNLIPAIGVYAALRKEQRQNLAYPGGLGPVLEAVDADLLAHTIDWAGTTQKATNQIFNVTNGDVFTWQNVWPAIAEALGMKPGDPEPKRLGESMPAHAQAWDEIRNKYNLVAPNLSDFVGESFYYADFVMAHGAEGGVPAALVSTIKLRQAGFHEVMDTEAMFRKWFAEMQKSKLLPPRG